MAKLADDTHLEMWLKKEIEAGKKPVLIDGTPALTDYFGKSKQISINEYHIAKKLFESNPNNSKMFDIRSKFSKAEYNHHLNAMHGKEDFLLWQFELIAKLLNVDLTETSTVYYAEILVNSLIVATNQKYLKTLEDVWSIDSELYKYYKHIDWQDKEFWLIHDIFTFRKYFDKKLKDNPIKISGKVYGNTIQLLYLIADANIDRSEKIGNKNAILKAKKLRDSINLKLEINEYGETTSMLGALPVSIAKEYVKHWEKGDKKIQQEYEKYFKDKYGAKYRIYLPLMDSACQGKSSVYQKVRELLLANGYSLNYDSYKAGYCTEEIETQKGKKSREVKIGKVLSKLDEALNKQFNEDPCRSNMDKHKQFNAKTNTIAVISRHPYDIAGMSTDRGDNMKSCMTLPTKRIKTAEQVLSNYDVEKAIFKRVRESTIRPTHFAGSSENCLAVQNGIYDFDEDENLLLDVRYIQMPLFSAIILLADAMLLYGSRWELQREYDNFVTAQRIIKYLPQTLTANGNTYKIGYSKKEGGFYYDVSDGGRLSFDTIYSSPRLEMQKLYTIFTKTFHDNVHDKLIKKKLPNNLDEEYYFDPLFIKIFFNKLEFTPMDINKTDSENHKSLVKIGNAYKKDLVTFHRAGQYCSMVKDSAQMSLIAYEIEPQDTNIENPKARILINPYKPQDVLSNAFIIKENSRFYGRASSQFVETVKQFCDKFNKNKPAGVYIRPRNLYEDGESGEYAHNMPKEDKEYVSFEKAGEFYVFSYKYDYRYLAGTIEEINGGLKIEMNEIFSISIDWYKVHQSAVNNFIVQEFEKQIILGIK